MTKTYCDRCGVELNRAERYEIKIDGDTGICQCRYDLCLDCRKDFHKIFMSEKIPKGR